jgi:DNA polymerase-3 subunit delta'
MSYPWLESAWQQLVSRHQAGRLPHAILLTGAEGLGKFNMAADFAHYMLCDAPVNNRACTVCRSCRLLSAGSHPDFSLIQPEEDGKQIKIDAIRDFVRFTALTPQYGGHKLAIISPANQMNRNAANSLLKTLEEPAGATIMLLVTSQPHQLPATIRSRCQRLHIDPPALEQASQWLAQASPGANGPLLLSLASGAPLRALQLAEQGIPAIRDSLFEQLESLSSGDEEPIGIAADWHKQLEAQPLHWFRQWIMDMIRIRSASEPPRLASPDLAGRLQQLADGLDLVRLYKFLDGLNEALRLITTTPVNPQLLIEEQLVRWTAIRRK